MEWRMMTEDGSADGKPATEGISIVTYEAVGSAPAARPRDADEEQDATLSTVGDVFRSIVRRKTTIAPESLQEKLSAFLRSMDTALGGIPALLGAYKVDEIELSLEIGAEGELSILGTGGKITGTSGITLTLKHVPSPTALPTPGQSTAS
jgi:hypothetical protein